MTPVRREIESYTEDLAAIRRDLHAHPEIGFQEHRTSGIVADALRRWGVEVSQNLGTTGVVGTIRGSAPGNRSIGLRADMDALPIHEASGVAHASKTAGTMHACGHDGHTAMLLGAARYLATHRDFSGTVHLIFQPAEEGLGGANAMLRDGLFERFACDEIFGLHNLPGLPLGTFTLREGPFMAAAGLFEVTFRGKGGHAGMVEHGRYDLTSVAARYILALGDLVRNEVPAGQVAVIRPGEVVGHGGTSLNVMPSTVYVGGTMRCFTSEVQELFNRRIPEIAHELARQADSAAAEVSLRWITSPLINAKEQTAAAVTAARSVSPWPVETDAKVITASEDFSALSTVVPGSFIFMGIGTAADGFGHRLHTPKYDFNDAAIPYGVEYFVRLTRQQLAQDNAGHVGP